MADTHTHSPSETGHAHEAVSHEHAAHGEEHNFFAHSIPYLVVGGMLLVFTAVTVWLSYFDFGSTQANVIIAMLVATVKVSLVGAIFMHLKGEKKTIWRPLFFTAFFVAGLFLLTLFHFYDPIMTSQHAHH